MRRRAWMQRVAALCAAPCLKPAHAQERRLRIGLTAVILADQAAFLTRWADYLSARLECPVSFVTRDEYQALHELLGSGQVDALWTCGYPYVRFQSQLQLLAVPLYRGQPTYQSYLIRAARDTSMGGWSDLRGKVFAYSDPLSNSGWLVAQGQLAAAGIAVHQLKRTFFTHGHRNVAEAVAARLAHAGAIDGYVWNTMREQDMAAASATDVIWKSTPHGFPPIVVPAGARQPLIGALQHVLLTMDRDVAGARLLQALHLDAFIAGAPKLYDSIRQLAMRVPGAGMGL